MTRTSCIQRAPETEWKVELLRLTTFHTHALLANTEGWWSGVTGLEPESVVHKPKSGDRAEVGRCEDWSLVLQVQPGEGRVDWIAGGIGEIAESSEFPPLSPRLPLFVDPMKRWFETMCPETKRLAFGAILQLSVRDRESGYRTLSNYLPFDLEPETSTDFLYQINRRRQSGTLPDVPINRLSKWSVGVLHQKRFTLSPSGTSTTSETNQPSHFCRLELDINTDQDVQGSLPRNRLGELLDEMVQLSLEIAREGDVR